MAFCTEVSERRKSLKRLLSVSIMLCSAVHSFTPSFPLPFIDSTHPHMCEGLHYLRSYSILGVDNQMEKNAGDVTALGLLV